MRTGKFGHGPTDEGGHGGAGGLDDHLLRGAEIVRGKQARRAGDREGGAAAGGKSGSKRRGLGIAGVVSAW